MTYFAITVDRLAHLLAHSGAVILMQQHSYEYHFSARLKPWVHYVPLTFSTADVIKKLDWLKKHDHMAYRIAKNARIFGMSYLRMEDYLCYDATLLQTLAGIMNTTDATVPFDPAPWQFEGFKIHR